MNRNTTERLFIPTTAIISIRTASSLRETQRNTRSRSPKIHFKQFLRKISKLYRKNISHRRRKYKPDRARIKIRQLLWLFRKATSLKKQNLKHQILAKTAASAKVHLVNSVSWEKHPRFKETAKYSKVSRLKICWKRIIRKIQDS